MLGAAEPDALRPEEPRDARVRGSVGVRADAQAARAVGPFEEPLEGREERRLLGREGAVHEDAEDFGGLRRELSQEDVARGAVHREEVAFLRREVAGAEFVPPLVHRDLARAHDAGFAHAAGDDRSVTRDPAPRRQDSDGRVHARDVFGRGLDPHEHDRVSLARHLDGPIRGERDPTAGGARAGRQPPGEETPSLDRRLLLFRRKHRRQELDELLRLDPQHRFLFGDQPFCDHIGRDPDRGEARPLAVARLEQIDAPLFDRELQVLHVAEALLDEIPNPDELRVRRRHRLLERLPGAVRCQRVRRADPGHDVFPLRVREELPVELLFAGRRVAGECHSGRGALAPIAEHHRLNVHRSAPLLRDPVEPAVLLRAGVVPRPEDRADRAPELLARIVREGRAAAPHDFLVAIDDPSQVLGRELGVELRAFFLPAARQEFLELLARNFQDDAGVHLEEPPAAVEREAFPGGRGEAGHGRPRQAEVQDRVHHAGHRRARAGPHRDQQRVRGVAELPARRSLDTRERFLDFRLNAVEVSRPQVIQAYRRLDRETGRHRNSERRHLGQAGALPAEDFFPQPGSFGVAVTKVMHSLNCCCHQRRHCRAAGRGSGRRVNTHGRPAARRE